MHCCGSVLVRARTPPAARVTTLVTGATRVPHVAPAPSVVPAIGISIKENTNQRAQAATALVPLVRVPLQPTACRARRASICKLHFSHLRVTVSIARVVLIAARVRIALQVLAVGPVTVRAELAPPLE